MSRQTYSRNNVPDSASAVWAIPLADGTGVVEVHKLLNGKGAERFHSVIDWNDRAPASVRGRRTWRSGTRGWGAIEAAQNDARWVSMQAGAPPP